MTIATMGFDGTIAGLVAVLAAVSTLVLNVFWVVAGRRYRGHGAKTLRALWIGYLVAPLLMASAFAFSVRLKPLIDCPEPFGGDGRPMGYIVAWVVLGSVISVVGVMIMAEQSRRKQTEPATPNQQHHPIRSPLRGLLKGELRRERKMKKTVSAIAGTTLLAGAVIAQSAGPLFKVDQGAMDILAPIDRAISGMGTNSPYLASWDFAKTNRHWTTEGKQVVVSHIQYSHNIQKIGSLATNLQYGSNACIISVGAPKKRSWSGLGIKTSIAGHINDRDILSSCQTWNPENPAFEEEINRTVKEVVATLKATMEPKSPNNTSDGIRQPAEGLPKPSR